MVMLPQIYFRQESSKKGNDNLEKDCICIYFHCNKGTLIHFYCCLLVYMSVHHDPLWEILNSNRDFLWVALSESR